MSNEDDLQQELQIEKITSLYSENKSINNQIRVVNYIGIIVVLALIFSFLMRLYGIYDRYKSYAENLEPANLLEVVQNPSSTAKMSNVDDKEMDAAVRSVVQHGHDRLKPALERFQKEVTDKALPEFSELVAKKFNDRSSEFASAGEAMIKNLQNHAENNLKEQIFQVIIEAMAKSLNDLVEIFPELSDKKLETELVTAKAHFYDKIYEQGEMQIAKIAPFLKVFQGRADQLTKGRKITAVEREAIFDEFLDGLLDRVKYELIPNLGKQDAVVEAPKENVSAKGGK